MKAQQLAAAVGVAAVMISVAFGTVAPASAASNIKPFGQGETLLDPATGAPMITYTVHGLNPSSDAVPHNGQLYEANVTAEGRSFPWSRCSTPALRAEPTIASSAGSSRQVLLRRRGRCTEQRRLQRRCSGSSDVDSRPSGRGYAPLAARHHRLRRADRCAHDGCMTRNEITQQISPPRLASAEFTRATR